MKTEENMISDWLEINGDPQIEIKVLNELVDKLIQEKDNFAIGFADWYLNLWHTDDDSSFDNNSPQELLEIYKKEKGL